MEGNASVYQVNPVRITGEGRAEFLRTWGSDFDQKGGGRGGGGKGQVGQLNSCVDTINPSCGGGGGGEGGFRSHRCRYVVCFCPVATRYVRFLSVPRNYIFFSFRLHSF